MKIHYFPAIAILIGTASFSLGRDSGSHVDAIITSFASNLASPLKGYANEDIGVKATEIRVDYGQGDLDLIVYGNNMGKSFGFKAEIRASIDEKSISVKFEEFPEIDQLTSKELDDSILILTEKINDAEIRQNPSDTAPTSTIRKFGPSGEKTICKAKSYYFSNKEYYLNDINKLLKLLRSDGK